MQIKINNKIQEFPGVRIFSHGEDKFFGTTIRIGGEVLYLGRFKTPEHAYQLQRFAQMVRAEQAIANCIEQVRKKNDKQGRFTHPLAHLRGEMTKSELAKKLGVTVWCVGSWERGATFPPQMQIFKMADLFNVDPLDLEIKMNEAFSRILNHKCNVLKTAIKE